MKRNKAMTALDHRRAWKNRAVRLVAVFWRQGQWMIVGGMEGLQTYRESELVDRFASDTHCQECIAENPKGDEACTEALVGILQGFLIMLDRSDVGSEGALHSGLKLTIDVGLRLVNFLNDCVFAAFVLGGLCRGESIRLVGALGTPGHIVPVAEGIDVEDVDVRRLQDNVGRKRGKHVPGVGIHEGGDEVETKCGSEGNDNDTSTRRSEERPQEGPKAFVRLEIHWCTTSEGTDDQVKRINHNVELNDTEGDEGSKVGELRTFRPVTQREDELQQQETEVDILHDGVDNGGRSLAEGEGRVVVAVAGGTHQVNDDSGSQPI